MSKVRVKLNYAGVQELLKGPEVRALLEECGSRVLDSLPDDGYEKETRTTDRAVVAVYAATAEARVKNSKSNTLLKALGAARI